MLCVRGAWEACQLAVVSFIHLFPKVQELIFTFESVNSWNVSFQGPRDDIHLSCAS